MGALPRTQTEQNEEITHNDIQNAAKLSEIKEVLKKRNQNLLKKEMEVAEKIST